MHNIYNRYQCPYNSNNLCNGHRTYPCPYYSNAPMYDSDFSEQYNPYANEMDYYARSTDAQMIIESKDYGSTPFVTNITEATKQNNNFRTALWTGTHLQLTLMSIPVGEDIGLEVHPNVDQFIRIESGQGLVKMGDNKNNLTFQKNVYDDFAIFIPAGKWHNIINTGYEPLKLYSIYAPPNHPFGTVHVTKAEAAE